MCSTHCLRCDTVHRFWISGVAKKPTVIARRRQALWRVRGFTRVAMARSSRTALSVERGAGRIERADPAGARRMRSVSFKADVRCKRNQRHDAPAVQCEMKAVVRHAVVRLNNMNEAREALHSRTRCQPLPARGRIGPKNGPRHAAALIRCILRRPFDRAARHRNVEAAVAQTDPFQLHRGVLAGSLIRWISRPLRPSSVIDTCVWVRVRAGGRGGRFQAVLWHRSRAGDLTLPDECAAAADGELQAYGRSDLCGRQSQTTVR
ncbi:hypothetical protein LMG27174_01987 [Paraburkholderia rhynchosiae]|uniref:Uncharacterized protein n=1 Tax=Paraburkholderia rhynchosiae TaxID=487049 RepID=A0A6J5AFY6_9BURK|nr:hypothetical protein LMG27174_01987 [Paraburkholderia rhynchosiae]